MASSTSTTTPAKHVADAFEQQCLRVQCPKDDLNAIILDYLTLEGYSDAASKFAKEANVQPMQTAEEVRMRQEVKGAIHSGQVQVAIDKVNAIDHRILEEDPALHFALLRLQLVELIPKCHGGDVWPALDFAKRHLAPRAADNPKYLSELEKTMALFIFPHDKLEPPIAYLLEPRLRRDVADMLNESITKRQTARSKAAMRLLVRLRQWSCNMAQKAKKDIPDSLEVNINGDEPEGSSDGHRENGHDPMVTS